MRLHPVEDGLIPEPDERGMTRRDSGGNKLVDVHDGNGFVTGVRSNLTIPSGSSVIMPTPVSGAKSAATPDVRFDAERQVYYDLIRSKDTDPVGLVVRTTADGDNPLKVTQIRIIEVVPTQSRVAERNSSAPVRPAVSVRSENDAAVKAVLDGIGYKGAITPQIRKAALEMIAIERNALKPLVREEPKKPKRNGKGRKPKNAANVPSAPKAPKEFIEALQGKATNG